MRMAYPGIFDLVHSIGKVIGESPRIFYPLRPLPALLFFHHQVFAEGLLEAGMELIAGAGAQRARRG